MRPAITPADPSTVQPTAEPRPPLARRGHLRHVDGMRAVAVLLVVGYHAGVPGLTGGFVGVDVFFVLSGFLITGLLLREVETTGGVDLLRFYARRARRLLPAAALVIVAVALAGTLLLPPISRGDLSTDVAAAALFVANWRYVLAATDYSGADVDQSPLLHFWSLAVEEQYYLLWPLMLLAAATVAVRSTRRHGRPGQVQVRARVGALLVVVLAASLTASVVLTGSTGTTAYFGLHTRAWELAVGGLLAVAHPMLHRVPPPAGRALVVLGLLAVAGSALVYSDGTSFPGSAALVPVLGTAAVIVGGLRSDGGATRLLSSRSAAAVGLVSYSWYLWHWPVLFFAGSLWSEPDLVDQGRAWGLPWAVIAASVALSLLLAVASYHLVEQPLRFAGPLVRSSGLSLLLGAVLVLAGLGGAALVRTSQPEAQVVTTGSAGSTGSTGGTGAAGMTVQEAAVDTMDTRGCHLTQRDLPVFDPSCVFGDPDADTRVLLVGDSHAEHWLPALDAAGREQGWQVELRSKSACNPVELGMWLPSEDREYVECAVWREALYDYAAEQERYDAVVLTWFDGNISNVYQGGRVLEEREALRAWGGGVEASARSWGRVTDEVVLLQDNPSPGYDVPECLSDNDGRSDACTFSVEGQEWLDGDLAEVEQQAVEGLDDARLVPTDSLVCGAQDRCATVTDDGVVKFRDGHHLTATFASGLVGPLVEALGPVARDREAAAAISPSGSGAR